MSQRESFLQKRLQERGVERDALYTRLDETKRALAIAKWQTAQTKQRVCDLRVALRKVVVSGHAGLAPEQAIESACAVASRALREDQLREEEDQP